MIYSDLYKDLCQMVQEKKSQHFFMFNSGKYRTNDIRRYKKILYSWVLGIYKKKTICSARFIFFYSDFFTCRLLCLNQNHYLICMKMRGVDMR